MSDLSIRKDFVDGVQEIFTTLFNSGKTDEEGNVDGMNLYLLSDKTKKNVYGENKYKIYQKPITLVTQAKLSPTQGEQDVEAIKDKAVFVTTLKSLQENNLGVTNKDLDTMRKGVICFNGVYYLVDNIVPKAYIEGVFLMYEFYCTEDKYITEILVEDSDSDG